MKRQFHLFQRGIIITSPAENLCYLNTHKKFNLSLWFVFVAAAAWTTVKMEQFEQLLTCAICLDRYRIPKLLPCQHSFCMEPCMDGLVDYVRRQVSRHTHTLSAPPPPPDEIFTNAAAATANAKPKNKKEKSHQTSRTFTRGQICTPNQSAKSPLRDPQRLKSKLYVTGLSQLF